MFGSLLYNFFIFQHKCAIIFFIATVFFSSDAGIQTEKSLEPQQPLRKDPVRLVCLCLFFKKNFCYSPSDGSQLLDSDGLFSPAEAAASNEGCAPVRGAHAPLVWEQSCTLKAWIRRDAQAVSIFNRVNNCICSLNHGS